MTGTIFQDVIQKWDRKLMKSKRKILLFMDNASSHLDLKLNCITLQFMPPNTTSHTQPLDQGIIKTWKGYYREKILQRVIGELDQVQLD